MRSLSALSLLLVPAVVVAQTPATPSLTERFNAEAKGINELLSQLKTQEAVAKAQAMIPAQAPVFNGSTPQAIFASFDDGRAYSMMHHALANAQGVAGQWEKGRETQEKRVAYTKQLRADILKAIQPIEEQWKKVVENATAYVAKNEPRKAELETKLAALQQEFKDVNEKKKKLSKEELADLNARGKVAQQEDQELQSIIQGLPVEKSNLEKEKKIRPILAGIKKDADELVKTAEESHAKIQKTIAQQEEEIQKFNTEQTEKAKKSPKKKVFTGSKDWVEAVMRGKDSVAKLPEPKDKLALLNRLSVLDPENKQVATAIENVQAGRDPFFKPKPAAKGKKTR